MLLNFIKNKIAKLFFAGVVISFFATSCTSVKEYQKNKINDAEMVLGNRKIEKSELSFQAYREGASGANGGKTGGGCGCN
ncbi:MAG: DUF4266 domain-containing protein [Ferruginibacter sp.]